MVDLINHIGGAIISFFAKTLMANTLFLALVLLMIHLFPKLSAGARYNIGLLGLKTLGVSSTGRGLHCDPLPTTMRDYSCSQKFVPLVILFRWPTI